MGLQVAVVAIFLPVVLLATKAGASSITTSPSGHSEDNIVRSFFPLFNNKVPPIPGEHEMLFFNISAVSGDEEVSKARLHLHRRRMSKPPAQNLDPQFLPSPARVVLYQARTRDVRPRRLASIPISQQSAGGWVPLDVTAVVREIHARPLLLGVRFEDPKGVQLTIHNFLKHKKIKKNKSSAYLVVLSKSDLHEGLEEPKERHSKHKAWKVDHNDMSNDIRSLAEPQEVRHYSKHKVYEVRRSKQAEQELRRRMRLHSLPFLHVNEVADMRRSLNKVKRSTEDNDGPIFQTAKEVTGCRRALKTHYSNSWILSYTVTRQESFMCEGKCQYVEQMSTSRRVRTGCCQVRRHDPLTIVTSEPVHGLTLHNLPGQLRQQCYCVPCAHVNNKE